MLRDLSFYGVYRYMIGQIRNPLVKQLVYTLIGFCVLTGIVFAIIYPEGKLSFRAAVFISMTVVAAFGSPVLLVVAIAQGSSSSKYQSGTSSGGGCGGGCGGGGCGGGG